MGARHRSACDCVGHVQHLGDQVEGAGAQVLLQLLGVGVVQQLPRQLFGEAQLTA
ncbi:hypothetical protein D3C73_1506880 [compost metagenome]